MTVDLELSVEDLSRVVFSAQAPALHEINVVAGLLTAGPAAELDGRVQHGRLTRALGVLGKITPGFLHAAPADVDEAVNFLPRGARPRLP